MPDQRAARVSRGTVLQRSRDFLQRAWSSLGERIQRWRKRWGTPQEQAAGKPARPSILGRVRVLLTDFLVITIAVTTAVLLVVEMQRELVVIEPFEVPEQVAARGYTGRAIARQLVDQLHHIERPPETRGWSRQRLKEMLTTGDDPSFVPSWDLAAVDISMQGSVSLKTIAAYLNEMLGRPPLKISGEVTLDEQVENSGAAESGSEVRQILRVTTRVGTHPATAHHEFFTREQFPPTLDRLLTGAAEDVYSRVEPLRLAEHYILSGSDYSRAEEILRECIRIEREVPTAMMLSGVLRMNRADLEGALRWFERAHERDPRLARNHLYWGNALRRLKRVEEAKAHLEEALGLEPGSADAQRELALVDLSENRPEHALGRIERARQFQSMSPLNDLYEARILHALGRSTEALDLLGFAAEVRPSYAPFLVESIRILDDLEHRDEASSLREELIRRATGG